MIRSIGIVTDSNSQFPDELVERYGVEIVPLTVTVDGTAYAEGAELTADDFYARYAGGATPEVSTAAPAPGAFVEAYERLVGRGADEILSIHIGAAVSGTINAAQVAVDLVDVPVRLVDTGTASFGVSCCVWEAADALVSGADAAKAAAVAETVAPSVGNVFVVGALDIVRAGGRLAAGTEPTEGVSVLSLVDGAISRVGAADDIDSATEAMAAHVLAAGEGLRVAVGIADGDAEPLSAALEDRLRGERAVAELVRYRIGPSVGAHTGPGTAGCFFWPAR
jgi:DegV family protein with EDD domain